MAYRQPLTTAEKKAKDYRRARLLDKFPGGVAEIVAICDRREPGVEGRPSLLDFQLPRASSTPAIPVYVESGGTHPVSGMPEVKGRKVDISIWPVSGRTDQAGELSKYYSPIEILEFLADDKMRLHGGRPIYKLVPVPERVLEAEKKSLTVPESRQAFETMKRQGVLQENAADAAGSKATRPSPAYKVVPIEEVQGVEEETPYLDDTDLNDDAPMMEEEEEAIV